MLNSSGRGAVARLRRRRGGQQVTFAEVADHFVDFLDRHPDSAPTVALLADYLVALEEVEHHHPTSPEPTLGTRRAGIG